VSAAPTLSHSSGGVSLLGLPIFYLSHFDVVKYAQPPFKWAVRNLVGAEPFILSLPRSTNSAMTIPLHSTLFRYIRRSCIIDIS